LSIIDIRDRLRDIPGAETMTMQTVMGRQLFGINGKMIGVPVTASDAEVEQTIRAGLASNALAEILPSPSSALLPRLNPQPAPKPRVSSMSVTGAGAAGQSLKSLMAQHKKLVEDAKTKLEGNFAKLAQAAQGMDKLGDGVGAEADELMASLAEFTNDVGGEA
jgi:hypothetical protein